MKRLQYVRTHGDFEGWICYYLKAIRDSSIDAHTRAKEIEKLENMLNNMIKNDPSFLKMRETAKIILNFLFTQPITSISEISQKTGKAYNTVQKTLNEFIKTGIISEKIIKNRNKIYMFDSYLNLLEKEYIQ